MKSGGEVHSQHFPHGYCSGSTHAHFCVEPSFCMRGLEPVRLWAHRQHDRLPLSQFLDYSEQ